MGPDRQVKQRLRQLEKHLKSENRVLVDVVKEYRGLDAVARQLGLLDSSTSYAFRVPWWPLVSIVGTFSAGKSSFVNSYLGAPLQVSGTQAVDDKFTVICYSGEVEQRTLPGIALDADPRFPFYQMREEIEKVAPNEGARIDSYIQLKTCNSERLNGQILIDSPGFDADSQRDATLRITEHILDLSDLVLVMFDARRPEPGAMRDTLRHLVAETVHRNDANKFLYILNQLDTAVGEDNPEDVVAAWQRAISYEGLTAGKFYTIYNPDKARPIEDEAVRQRLDEKSDADREEIYARIDQVRVERLYRVVSNLDRTAAEIRDNLIPQLQEYKRRYRRAVLWRYAGTLFPLLLGLVGLGVYGAMNDAGWWQSATESVTSMSVTAVVLLVPLLLVSVMMKRAAARKVIKRIQSENQSTTRRNAMLMAFSKNSKWWRDSMSISPIGWNIWSRRRLDRIHTRADDYVQALNKSYTNPSGEGVRRSAPVTRSQPEVTGKSESGQSESSPSEAGKSGTEPVNP